ncbi:hypothetical protein BH24CHL6_BH24CHL6_00470 [soil metagenome]
MIRGTVAGLLATVPMSAFMLLAHRLGWLNEQAPEEITARSLERVTDHRPGGLALDLLTALAHLAFGALSGVVYALSLGRLSARPVPGVVTGALYGASVWLGSYWGVLPRLGLMPPPPRDERRRPLVMLVAHWIYGAALGLLLPALKRAQPVGQRHAARPG